MKGIKCKYRQYNYEQKKNWNKCVTEINIDRNNSLIWAILPYFLLFILVLIKKLTNFSEK